MALADFTAEPLGSRTSSYPFSGFQFMGANLRVRDDTLGGPHGLTFSTSDLRIELDEPAAHVYIDLTVYNSTRIEALDSAGTVMGPPKSFGTNAGWVSASFHAPKPAIRALRVTVGDDENMIHIVTSL